MINMKLKLLAIAVVLALFLTVLGIREMSITEKLKDLPELKGLSPLEITQLTDKQLEPLKETQPGIYKEIKEGTYRVIYDLGTTGLLVLYDENKHEIVKMFEVMSADYK